MSIDDKKDSYEVLIKQLEKKELELAEIEDQLIEEEAIESEICTKIKEDIKQLECMIAELEVQSKSTMQLEVNSTMLEYSHKNEDPRNSALCSSLKNKAATILYRDFEGLIHTAAKYYRWRGTRQDYEDAVQTALLNSFEKYDPKRNNNFCVWFYRCLLYAVLEARKKDVKKYSIKDENGKKQTIIINQVNWPTIKDDEGNETPFNPPDLTEDVEDRVDHYLKYEAFMLNMSVCVMEIINHGNCGKSEAYKYFPLFATDRYISCAKMGLHRVVYINERKAFEVMNDEFLNYALSDICHSLSDIAITPFKTYIQIDKENLRLGRMRISERKYGQGYGPRPIMLFSPLENVAFMDFLNMSDTNTNQTKISNQKRAFNKKIGIVESDRIE